ncbi:MAG: PilZ domain-containing protein [Sphingomonadales bacterium]|nr:PilZ domain-containing protein [Sphingomonadales bacterium]
MASLSATVSGIGSLELHDQRVDDRLPIDRQAVLRADGIAHEIHIEDLTREGCRITTDLKVATGASIALGIAGVGRVYAQVVWGRDGTYGCVFDAPLPSGSVTAATLNNVQRFVPPREDAATFAADDAKLPLRQRAIIIVGATSLLWAALIGGAWLVF